MTINLIKLDTSSEVRDFLEKLYSNYKNVEILGITEGIMYSIFYKIGDKIK